MSGRGRVDRVREAAVRILARWQRERVHVEELLRRHELDAGSASSWPWPERRRLRELVYSCVRLHGRYDFVVERRRHRGRKPSPELNAIFWVALHELTEHGAPGHAVVDEAVKLATRMGAAHAKGFVNALLRGVVRDGATADFGPDADARTRAVTWESHPRWLVDRWADSLGEDEMLRLCAANNARPRIHLRAAPGRREHLLAAMREKGWEASPLDFLPDAVELQTRVPPALVLEQAGEPCTVQDAAAQLVAPLLAASSPVRILDLCAAPGGKATHLAQLLGESRVVAADLAPQRVARVRSALERLGLTGRVDVVVADGMRPPFPGRSFDAVLLDAPCTGTGVLSRRHDARWIREPGDLGELATLQRGLLQNAIDLVGPGGTVVYATCSLEPEENDEVVDFVLGSREDVREWPLDDEVDPRFLRSGRLATWPHRHGIDGAFAARLRKGGPPAGEDR